MKLLIFFLFLSGVSFSQSKKEQIVALKHTSDSLKELAIKTQKNIGVETHNCSELRAKCIQNEMLFKENGYIPQNLNSYYYSAAEVYNSLVKKDKSNSFEEIILIEQERLKGDPNVEIEEVKQPAFIFIQRETVLIKNGSKKRQIRHLESEIQTDLIYLNIVNKFFEEIEEKKKKLSLAYEIQVKQLLSLHEKVIEGEKNCKEISDLLLAIGSKVNEETVSKSKVEVFTDLTQKIIGFEKKVTELKNEAKNPATETENKELINDLPEEFASFPGGMVELKKYIAENINYPDIFIEKKISGTVYVKFIVSTEGDISNVKVTKGMEDCPECGAETIRLFSAMPKWIPAKNDGKTVNSYYNAKVKFQIN